MLYNATSNLYIKRVSVSGCLLENFKRRIMIDSKRFISVESILSDKTDAYNKAVFRWSICLSAI